MLRQELPGVRLSRRMCRIVSVISPTQASGMSGQHRQHGYARYTLYTYRSLEIGRKTTCKMFQVYRELNIDERDDMKESMVYSLSCLTRPLNVSVVFFFLLRVKTFSSWRQSRWGFQSTWPTSCRQRSCCQTTSSLSKHPKRKECRCWYQH
jgi:hypothetical protein